ncbi:unnamed protein product, partial [Polarella glacialis]
VLDVGAPTSLAPTTAVERDRVLEAHVAQLDRCLRERGVSLLQACELLDPASKGFLDRGALRRLLAAAGVDLADWEQEELIMRCDTTGTGQLNYKEMTRQFDFEVQARAAARAASAGTEDKAAWEKIGQVAQQLYARGASLVESFAPY